jgi:phage baseplate assembly protein W
MEATSFPFPVRLNARGGIELVSGREAVEACFSSILLTVAGERVMRPELGINLDWRTDELAERIPDLLANAEPRAVIHHVEVRADPMAGNVDAIDALHAFQRIPHGLRLIPFQSVSIDYSLRDTAERHRFVGVIEWIG